MDKLQEARKIISQVDEEMAALFVRRMEAAVQVAEYKKERGLPIFDGAREKEILEKGAARVTDPHRRVRRADPDRHTAYTSRTSQGTSQ